MKLSSVFLSSIKTRGLTRTVCKFYSIPAPTNLVPNAPNCLNNFTIESTSGVETS